MSQTETLLLFVLGFSLAALIALFLGRLLWAAALRIGARRMQKQVPSTLVGLQTERDRLRAEYAMISQRLGTRLEAAKLKMAEQMAEVTRHRNRLGELEDKIAERDAEIAGLTEKSDQLAADLAAAAIAYSELESNLTDRQSALDAAQAQIADLKLTAAQSIPDIPAADDDIGPQERMRRRIGKLTLLAQNVADGHKPDHPADPVIADPLVQEKLGEAERQTADLQKELEVLDAEWSKRLDELQEQDKGSATRQSGSGTGAVANVISLANRIRDLHKDIGNG